MKYSDAASPGPGLGVLQSARVRGPATGGVLDQTAGCSAPYVAAAAGMAVADVFSFGLHPPASAKPGSPELQTT